ncbi:MAG: hypothetical protein HOW97_08070 [Catenulispora sp.]|nr:hypothetical protein [Catenulispora sp.]
MPSPSYLETPYSSPSGDTPEEKVNKLAAADGWVPDDEYATADQMVQDVCDTLTDHKDPSLGSTPAQWLGQYGYDTTEQIVIGDGVPLLCPQWAATVKAAFGGQYARQIDDGTWHVTSKPGQDNVAPGTYRTIGDLSNCYWERTRADGTIIDNQYATAASRITMTIKASDDTFTTRGCGTWEQVR